jgi:vacuolar-type H+-ATPase subunit I/STV1
VYIIHELHPQAFEMMSAWGFLLYGENKMNEDLVAKFQELKAKHAELTAEKLKYEAKKEQLTSEIKAIQDKYKQYDLSSVESVEKIISDLTAQLETELKSISERYAAIKAV